MRSRPSLFVRARWRRLDRLIGDVWRHPANAGHRFRALLRVAAFHGSARVLGIRTRTRIGDHSRIWADRRFVSSVKVTIGNPPDWAEMQVWKRILRPGELFVDVGANVGIYSLWASDLGCEVIAVEPESTARAALCDNAALNGVTFEVIPSALSREPGTMRFTDHLSTMNHLLADDEPGGVEVDVRTLDDVLGNRTAHGLKIDVEGAEQLVLEGAVRALREGRLPVIQLEWNVMSERVFGTSRALLADMLGRYGYRFYRADADGGLLEVGTETTRGDIFALLEEPS